MEHTAFRREEEAVKKLLLILMLSSLIVVPGCKKVVHLEEKDAATECAENWLKIVDNGHYERSWDKASDYFRKSVPRDMWAKQLTLARRSLGKPVSRKVLDKRYLASESKRTSGEFVVIEFETEFRRRTVKEVVTPLRGSNGQWRVSSYFIK